MCLYPAKLTTTLCISLHRENFQMCSIKKSNAINSLKLYTENFELTERILNNSFLVGGMIVVGGLFD